MVHRVSGLRTNEPPILSRSKLSLQNSMQQPESAGSEQEKDQHFKSEIPYATLVASSLLGEMTTVIAIPMPRSPKNDGLKENESSSEAKMESSLDATSSEGIALFKQMGKKRKAGEIGDASSSNDFQDTLSQIPRRSLDAAKSNSGNHASIHKKEDHFKSKATNLTVPVVSPKANVNEKQNNLVMQKSANPRLVNGIGHTGWIAKTNCLTPSSNKDQKMNNIENSTTEMIKSGGIQAANGGRMYDAVPKGVHVAEANPIPQAAPVASPGPRSSTIPVGTAVSLSLSQKKKKQRRKRIFWTTMEETHLRLGVREFGTGKWAKILQKYGNIFKNRTSVDLKDKWRNISKKSPDTIPIAPPSVGGQSTPVATPSVPSWWSQHGVKAKAIVQGTYHQMDQRQGLFESCRFPSSSSNNASDNASVFNIGQAASRFNVPTGMRVDQKASDEKKGPLGRGQVTVSCATAMTQSAYHQSASTSTVNIGIYQNGPIPTQLRLEDGNLPIPTSTVMATKNPGYQYHPAQANFTLGNSMTSSSEMYRPPKMHSMQPHGQQMTSDGPRKMISNSQHKSMEVSQKQTLHKQTHSNHTEPVAGRNPNCRVPSASGAQPQATKSFHDAGPVRGYAV
mmetsp:Transcript_26959/g.37498  ORF Transcript_26959/g.37498 Transcript_26959/m.37498 type:complete len:621 (+) Transcript_26959:73-1935(+)